MRDQIHASDLVRAIDCFIRNPKPGEVYNMGGGRKNNVSVLEALNMCGIKNYEYINKPRLADHIWYISDTRKFESHYPDWKLEYNLWSIFDDLQNHGCK